MSAAFHVERATAEPLLSRLDRVKKSGDGWMARCPAHDDRTASLSVTEAPDKVLVHCFGGCRTEDVLAAVGLEFKDLFPPRPRPESPAEFRQHRLAVRRGAWGAALQVLPLEVKIVQLAAAKLLRDEPLQWDDYERLVKAAAVIDNAAGVLTEVRDERA